MADRIPVDILWEIFVRLPVKSLVRFVCVSNLWARIIRGEDFIRWFSSPSSPKKQPQPRFLLAFNEQVKGYQENWYFYSQSTMVSTMVSTQPAPGPNQLATLWRKRFARRKQPPEAPVVEPADFVSSTVCQLKRLRYNEPSYVHGLICFLYGEEQVVCNPSTGKSITLPTVKHTEMIVRSFIGYDPIDAQYKVLCLTNITRFCEHQVLTLGSSAAQTRNCSWRMIQCSTPHSALGTTSVCIDGVLYYTASASVYKKEPFLARFDLRSETLEFASMFPEGIESYNLRKAVLINYHGKAALVTGHASGIHSYTFTLWVLEDAKKQEWSKERLCFSILGATGKFHDLLEMLGASDMGEFIYAPVKFEELYVYFVDHKSNRVRSVELQGNTKHKFKDFYEVFTFLHHVQSLMFI